ncbi:MAG: hypothetical protein NWF01_08850 [Candidatus Bathyarchaeota archaeon]|nr:hypothetical protein [Candidatus Bathyarchaeota archaeon]
MVSNEQFPCNTCHRWDENQKYNCNPEKCRLLSDWLLETQKHVESTQVSENTVSCQP